MCFLISIVFLTLSLVGCVKYEGGGGGMVSGYVKNPDQADVFFNELKAKLSSAGFTPCPPPDGVINSGDKMTWFRGRYEGSPAFYLSVIRDGSDKVKTFHMQYQWNIATYSSHRDEMHEKALALNQALINWIKNDTEATYVGGGP